MRLCICSERPPSTLGHRAGSGPLRTLVFSTGVAVQHLLTRHPQGQSVGFFRRTSFNIVYIRKVTGRRFFAQSPVSNSFQKWYVSRAHSQADAKVKAHIFLDERSC